MGQKDFSNILSLTSLHPADNNILTFQWPLPVLENYVRFESKLMGFELGYKGERKKKRTEEKLRLSQSCESTIVLVQIVLNCTIQILEGRNSFLFLHI